MKITSDYDSHTKEELLAELQERGVTDVPTSTLKSDIVARLELEDEAAKSDPKDIDPKNVDLKKVARADGAQDRQVPADLHEYAGKYRIIKDPFPDEIFGLKVIDEARHNKTHLAKSPIRFGDYTKEEFRALFEKL